MTLSDMGCRNWKLLCFFLIKILSLKLKLKRLTRHKFKFFLSKLIFFESVNSLSYVKSIILIINKCNEAAYSSGVIMEETIDYTNK